MYTLEYMGVKKQVSESRNKSLKKSDFVIFFH